jgi:two-component system OmpR family response regulator
VHDESLSEFRIMTENLKIMYVDDEEDIRTIVEFALEDEEDFTLKLCASGQEAIDIIGTYQPDFILLDVMMPGMDGPTTLRKLRQLPGLEAVPVAFVTAKVQPKEVAEFKAMGAANVIAKPFDPMSLADQVRTIWEENHHK